MTPLQREQTYFTAFIFEAYKRIRKKDSKDVLALFNENRILEWLYENYETLHTVDVEYVVDEIDNKIKQNE